MAFNIAADMLLVAGSEWLTAKRYQDQGDKESAQKLAAMAVEHALACLDQESFAELAGMLNEYNEHALAEHALTIDVDMISNPHLLLDSPVPVSRKDYDNFEDLLDDEDDGVDPELMQNLDSPEYSPGQGDGVDFGIKVTSPPSDPPGNTGALPPNEDNNTGDTPDDTEDTPDSEDNEDSDDTDNGDDSEDDSKPARKKRLKVKKKEVVEESELAGLLRTLSKVRKSKPAKPDKERIAHLKRAANRRAVK